MSYSANRITLAFSGAPGVGKTTIARAIAAKVQSPLTVAFSEDVARSLAQQGVRINLDCGVEDYLAFLAVRLKDMLKISADIVIYERTLLDVLVFMQLNGNTNVWLETLARELIEWQLSQLSVYFYVPIEFNSEVDGVRIVDSAINHRIDQITLDLLKTYRPDFVTLTGSVEKRTQQVLCTLSERSITLTHRSGI